MDGLIDGASVWVAWAGATGAASPLPAHAEAYQADVVSAADRLVRMRDSGRLRVLYFEKIFGTEAEAKSHVVKTLRSLASEINSLADRYR